MDYSPSNQFKCSIVSRISYSKDYALDSFSLSAVNEVQSGALQSFDISSTGVLSNPVDTVSSGGDSPAHVVPLSDGEVAIMNVSYATMP